MTNITTYILLKVQCSVSFVLSWMVENFFFPYHHVKTIPPSLVTAPLLIKCASLYLHLSCLPISSYNTALPWFSLSGHISQLEKVRVVARRSGAGDRCLHLTPSLRAGVRLRRVARLASARRECQRHKAAFKDAVLPLASFPIFLRLPKVTTSTRSQR